MSGRFTQVLVYHTIKQVKRILNKYQQNMAKKHFCSNAIVVCSLFVVAPFVFVCVRGGGGGCLVPVCDIILCVFSS